MRFDRGLLTGKDMSSGPKQANNKKLENLTLTQWSCLKDLGIRYAQELQRFGKPPVPMCPSFNEDLLEDTPSPEQIRRAQGIVGELLWASIRTRPDAAFSVQAC